MVQERRLFRQSLSTFVCMYSFAEQSFSGSFLSELRLLVRLDSLNGCDPQPSWSPYAMLLHQASLLLALFLLEDLEP